MQFRAFGGLEVERDGELVALGGPRQRRLLAALLVDAERPVPIDRLVEAVWPDGGSEASARTVLSYVSRLRQSLAPAAIVRGDGAYTLKRHSASFDLDEFGRGCDAARAAADDERRLQLLDRALGLWRGRPFGDLADDPLLHPLVVAAEERRLQAVELRYETALALGDDTELLPDLQRLVDEHPLRERLRASLMLALYRSGRQAEALRAFERFRSALADETGLQPSADLHSLDVRIARSDPLLARPRRMLRSYELVGRSVPTAHGVRRAARAAVTAERLTIFSFASTVADDPRFVTAFDGVGEVLQDVRDPTIQRLVDHWREPGAAHLVYAAIDPDTACADGAAIVRCASEAVAELHARGIVHGAVETSIVTTASGSVLCFAGIEHLAAHGALDPRVDTAAVETLAARWGCLDDVGRLAHVARSRDESPYVGLRSFRAPDQADFYGRERVCADLLRRLDADARLTIVGPSGCGKSSVVHAGLVPMLRTRPGSLVVTLTPGAVPAQQLREALASVAVEASDTETAPIASGPLAGLPADLARLVIVVDQAEELWSIAPNEARAAFHDHLDELLALPLVSLLVALRADFLDAAMADRDLGPTIATHIAALPPLSGDDLRRAIVAPAAAAGVDVQPDVVERLVAATDGRSAALPLLQFTLAECFERRRGDVIDAAVADQVGVVDRALARRADEVFAGLDAAEQLACRALMARLVDTAGSRRDLRRRAGRGELDTMPPHLLDVLGAERLLEFDRDPLTREGTVEVAHEALLRHWDRAVAWIAADADDITALHRLTDAAAEWHVNGRGDVDVARGAALSTCRRAAARWGESLSSIESALVARSTWVAEQDRHARRAHAATRRRLAVVLAVAALVAAAATTVAVIAARRSSRADARADRTLAATTRADAGLLHRDDLGDGWARASADQPVQVFQRAIATTAGCTALATALDGQRAQAGPALFLVGAGTAVVLSEVHVFDDESTARAAFTAAATVDAGSCIAGIATAVVAAAEPMTAGLLLSSVGVLPPRPLAAAVAEQHGFAMEFTIPALARLNVETWVLRSDAVLALVAVPTQLGPATVDRIVDTAAARLAAAVSGGSPSLPTTALPTTALTTTALTTTALTTSVRPTPTTVAVAAPTTAVTSSTIAPDSTAVPIASAAPADLAPRALVDLADLGPAFVVPTPLVEPEVAAALDQPRQLPECPDGMRQSLDPRSVPASRFALFATAADGVPLWITSRAFDTVDDAESFLALTADPRYAPCSAAAYAVDSNLGPIHVGRVGTYGVVSTEPAPLPPALGRSTGWRLTLRQSGGTDEPAGEFTFALWSMQRGQLVVTVEVDTRVGDAELSRLATLAVEKLAAAQPR